MDVVRKRCTLIQVCLRRSMLRMENPSRPQFSGCNKQNAFANPICRIVGCPIIPFLERLEPSATFQLSFKKLFCSFSRPFLRR
ncbi:hypothetical protein V6N13_139648 [Hibiscus sabdariffa]|uniref:Uncharacterized protein n=1 Tax=Hibiscus sabdariffa TaxID=183260 RepID=A0ABR2C7I7_9ROSI